MSRRDERLGRAPGWYPDPDDRSLIRYWDGRGWTGQRRERPSWAGPAPVSAPGHKGRRRTSWFLAAGALLAFALASFFAITSSRVSIPARSVADRGFTDAANRTCAATIPALRQRRPQPGQDKSAQAPNPKEDLTGNAAVAARIEEVAATLGTVQGQIRQLPVADADRPRVETWLDDWDEYIRIGHRYADALRANDARRYAADGVEGDRVSRRIYVFSRANGMPECTF